MKTLQTLILVIFLISIEKIQSLTKLKDKYSFSLLEGNKFQKSFTSEEVFEKWINIKSKVSNLCFQVYDDKIVGLERCGSDVKSQRFMMKKYHMDDGSSFDYIVCEKFPGLFLNVNQNDQLLLSENTGENVYWYVNEFLKEGVNFINMKKKQGIDIRKFGASQSWGIFFGGVNEGDNQILLPVINGPKQKTQLECRQECFGKDGRSCGEIVCCVTERRKTGRDKYESFGCRLPLGGLGVNSMHICTGFITEIAGCEKFKYW